MWVFKYLIHRNMEGLGDAKGQIQRGIVLSGFQGIDRLSRNPDLFAQFILRPVLLGPEHFEFILHGVAF